MDDIEQLSDALNRIANAIGRVASGGQAGPEGLEGLGVAIAGEGMRRPLGEAIEAAAATIAEAINGLAEQVESLASSVSDLGSSDDAEG